MIRMHRTFAVTRRCAPGRCQGQDQEANFSNFSQFLTSNLHISHQIFNVFTFLHNFAYYISIYLHLDID